MNLFMNLFYFWIILKGEPKSFRGKLKQLRIALNSVSRGEHVPDIERHIRTVKDSS